MPWDARLSLATVTVLIALARPAFGAALAPPTYVNVERSIEAMRRGGSGAAGNAPSQAGRRNALLDSLLQDLRACSKAASLSERLQALERLDQKAGALGSVGEYPGADLYRDLERWLQPRLRLARAMKQLTDLVAAPAGGTDKDGDSHRAHWLDFVEKNLGQALREYDAADTVALRQAALERIHGALETLKRNNQRYPWGPSYELQAAASELFNQPNVHIRADLATVRPVFERNIITTGPVRRKQYVSQLTAGPKTGFGLLTSNAGIAFFNSQRYTSVTPVWDFHDQIAADEQGQRAARMYHFDCTTYDWAELTITTVISTAGVSLAPCYHHTIDASITTEPVCDPHAHVLRTLASLAGMDQQAINDRVYEQSIKQFRERIPVEAQEQGEEMTAKEAAKRSAALREQFIVGNDGVALGRRIVISGVAIGSRPDSVLANGLFHWRGAERPRGADMPVPTQLPRPETGASAVVHPASMLTNLAAGFLQTGDMRTVGNFMIVVKTIPPGAPPSQALELTRDVDFPTYARTVEDIRTGRRAKGTALRIAKPARPPHFSTDSRGFLVASFHDLQIDVPAPSLEARGVIGPPAKIYRIKMPNAELAASYQFDVPSPRSLRLRLKIEDFTPGSGAAVLAIDADEAKAPSLSRFSTGIVIGALGARLRSRPFELFPDQSPLRGFTIQSVSPLDASGWARVNLVRLADGTAEAGEQPPSRADPGQRGLK
ncbi:MAG: hypothetical protein ACLQIB_42330 [Isosphaeraceae bacterium]